MRGLTPCLFSRRRDVFFSLKRLNFDEVLFTFLTLFLSKKKETMWKIKVRKNLIIHSIMRVLALLFTYQHPSTLNVGELSHYIWPHRYEHKKFLRFLPAHGLSCCENWRISPAELSLCLLPYLRTRKNFSFHQKIGKRK